MKLDPPSVSIPVRCRDVRAVAVGAGRPRRLARTPRGGSNFNLDVTKHQHLRPAHVHNALRVSRRRVYT